MKNLDLINESIQKMAKKLSEGAIMAAQSIAKEIDNASLNKYEITWRYFPIQNSETVDVVNITNKPSFVCRIYDTNMKNEVFEIFEGVDVNKIDEKQSMKMLSIVMGWPNQS